MLLVQQKQHFVASWFLWYSELMGVDALPTINIDFDSRIILFKRVQLPKAYRIGHSVEIVRGGLEPRHKAFYWPAHWPVHKNS
jgi:hypothetical protein